MLGPTHDVSSKPRTAAAHPEKPAEGQEVKRAVLVQRVVRHKRILRQGVPEYVDWPTTK